MHDEPISPWIEVEPLPRADLDPISVLVDPSLAAALATAHTREFTVAAMDTAQGAEALTTDIPNAKPEHLDALEPGGLIREGSVVGPGSVLVGKVTPLAGAALSPEEKLLRAIFGDAAGEVRDTSLRCPPGCAGTIHSARLVATEGKDELARASVVIGWERPLAVGDELLLEGADGPSRAVVAAITPLGGSRRLAVRGDRLRAAGPLRVAKVSMVEDLIHARSIGPYSIVTQQPLGGRESFGGQLLEPPQVTALAARAPWIAWEMFTIKSDSVAGRMRAYESLVRRVDIERPTHVDEGTDTSSGTSSGDIFSVFETPRRPDARPGDVPAEIPESVDVLARELAALGIEVRFAAPELGPRLLRDEEQRARSHGEVTRPETINYRTLAPEQDGLFCQRIFGPVKDYECACGKYRRMKHRGVVCESCGVEVIASKVRRERFAHVALAAPVVHPLFKAAVAKLLQLEPAQLEAVLAGTSGLDDAGRPRALEGAGVEGLETGGAAIRSALTRRDLEAGRFMLEILLVLPPDLRPLVPLDGGRFATSDLNDLYRRVINRNNRLARLVELAAPAIILHNESAQLQQAVDQLFANERTAKPARFEGRALRSLGRAVEDRFPALVRRRVDYSGVSRMVVDPTLAEGRCRLPRRMALELFKPMAFGIMETQGFVSTIKSAKVAVERGLDYALAAIAEASAETRLLLVGAGGLVTREVELWDEAAVAVDARTARLLGGPERDSSVCVHVPLGAEARREAASFPDIDDLETFARATMTTTRETWLGAAVFAEGLDHGLDRICEALLAGRVEPVEDPLLTAALGRGPADEGPTGAFIHEEDDDF